MGQAILVRKLDEHGRETWRYTGKVLARGENYVRLEAFFNRNDQDFQEIRLKKNDRFVETFYDDRWYNIFEIYDREDDHLKAWYCNIGYPAEIEDNQVSYRDLALDLLVYPDGRQVVLDEDEFEALALPEESRQQAQIALVTLKTEFAANSPA